MRGRSIIGAVVLALLVPASAFANAAVTSIGPRVGLSIDPDQFVFGGHLTVGEIAPEVTFDPSVEFGVGDDITVIAVNLDGKYHIRLDNTPWRPFFGFGLGINFIEFDAGPFRDSSETEVGANIIIGAGVPTRSGNRFFAEMRFGMGDIPDLKFMAGWGFRL